MSLAADLERLHERRTPSIPCTAQAALAQMDEADRAAVLDVLDNHRASMAALAQTLRAHGYDVNKSALQRHRHRSTGKGCVCPR